MTLPLATCCRQRPNHGYVVEMRVEQHPAVRGYTVCANAGVFSLLLALTPSCGSSLTEVMYVDHAFTSEERADIQAAADEWDRKTSGAARVQLDFHGSGIRDHDGVRSMVRAVDGELSSEDGGLARMRYDDFGNPTSETLLIAADAIAARSPGSFRKVVLHELGHHFGAPHVFSDPNAVMLPKIRPLEQLAPADVDAFFAGPGVER